MASGGSRNNVLITFVLLALVAGGAVAYKFWPWSGEGGTLPEGQVVELPFIFWGGDVATFHANGGLETKPDSIFGKLGVNLKLVPGDDFKKQVDDYLSGKSPFLRGTMSMLGQFSDKLTAKAGSVPVVFLQLTWSAGDHMVARENIKRLDDLKGKKIALQMGGPHVGMLNDILHTARLDWKDITVVWTDDVSGDKGPAELFRKDKSIDACFAITPDMEGLTGGLESTGTAEKSQVPGAHVLVSTAQMSRSIADVYAVRKDFYDKYRAFVQKVAAGYLKGCEELIGFKTHREAEASAKTRYQEIIQLAQEIWGKDPALKDQVAKEDDVDGLISDATFVGLPGNITFFTKEGNLSGFSFKMKQALVLPDDPANQSLKLKPKEFLAADFKYDKLKSIGGLTGKASKEDRFKQVAEESFDTEKTIYSFNIHFKPNQSDFNEAQYGADFQRALEVASLFGNSLVVIRGHADPTLLVQLFNEEASKEGLVTRDGAGYKFKDGKPVDGKHMKQVLELIAANDFTGRFEGKRFNLKEAVRELESLSKERGAAVRQAVIGYGGRHNLVLEPTQMREEGVGVKEPIILFSPLKTDWQQQNRRVEFSIIRLPAGKVKGDTFDL